MRLQDAVASGVLALLSISGGASFAYYASYIYKYEEFLSSLFTNTAEAMAGGAVSLTSQNYHVCSKCIGMNLANARDCLVKF